MTEHLTGTFNYAGKPSEPWRKGQIETTFESRRFWGHCLAGRFDVATSSAEDRSVAETHRESHGGRRLQVVQEDRVRALTVFLQGASHRFRTRLGVHVRSPGKEAEPPPTVPKLEICTCLLLFLISALRSSPQELRGGVSGYQQIQHFPAPRPSALPPGPPHRRLSVGTLELL